MWMRSRFFCPMKFIYRPKVRVKRLMVLSGCVLDMLIRHGRTPAGSGLPCSPLRYVCFSLSLIFSLFSLPFLGLGLDCRLVGFCKLRWPQFCGHSDLLTPLKKGVLVLSFIWGGWNTDKVLISHVHISGLQPLQKIHQMHILLLDAKYQAKWNVQISNARALPLVLMFCYVNLPFRYLGLVRFLCFWKKYLMLSKCIWSEMQ